MNGRSCALEVGWLVLAAAVAGAGLATPVAGTGLATPVAGAGFAAPGAGPGPVGGTTALQETDSTVTRITIAGNGSATWQVQIRTRLTGDDEVAEYETFQERFRENTSEFLDPFRERMRGVVAEAANQTGRPMEAEHFEAETDIQTVPRRWGVVTYEFRWRQFAAQDGDALVVGDVFRGQFYLTRNDTLAVTAPQGYAVTAVDPSPAEQEGGTVRWFGQRSFPEDTPAVRFEPVASTSTSAGPNAAPGDGTDRPGGTGTRGGTDEPTETTPRDGVETSVPPDPGGGSSLPLAAAVLVGGLVAVGAYRFYANGAGPDGERESSTPGGAGGSVTVDAGDGTAVGGGPGTGEESSAEPAGVATGSVDPDPVLTDADRVEQLLTEAGGEMKQSDIVDALDWSKSKTSRVLSDMAEADRVEKLRIGRENVISLPTEDSSGDENEDGKSPDGGDEVE